jgi:hypothetical protein
MRDLEEVDRRQALREQRRVDVLLDIPGQQEAPLTDDAEQHDRHVVDAATGIGRVGRDPAADGPQHAHRDLVDREPIAGADRQAWRSPGPGQPIDPGRVARPRSAHAGLQDATHPIAIEQQREAGDMILVRMRQDDGVQPSVPRRDSPIELDEEPVGIGPAVDEQPPSVGALDEDRVALTDVEDRDPYHARRPRDDYAAGDRHGHDQAHGRQPAGHGRALRSRARSRSQGARCRRTNRHGGRSLA